MPGQSSPTPPGVWLGELEQRITLSLQLNEASSGAQTWKQC